MPLNDVIPRRPRDSFHANKGFVSLLGTQRPNPEGLNHRQATPQDIIEKMSKPNRKSRDKFQFYFVQSREDFNEIGFV
jgi:hypothetical protein